MSSLLRGALAAAFAVSVVSPIPALACSICGCGDPLVVAGDAMPVRGNVRFALEAEYLSAVAEEPADHAAGDHGGTESLMQFTLRPTAVYSPVDSVNVVLQIPLARKAWALTGAEEESANMLGLGDVDLGARWFFFRDTNFSEKRRQGLALSAGSSLPTGANDAAVEGVRVDEHAQLGTGSFGPYAGLLYAFHQDPWNATVNVSGRAHTANAEGYRYGAALLWSVRGTYRAWDPFAFSLGIDGRWAQRDNDAGEWVHSSGGFLLAATPEVTARITPNLWLRALAQIPFYANLFGEQRMGPTFLMSFQYSLAN